MRDSLSNILEARAVSKILEGELPVSLVKQATLSIKEGEFVVISGPSGSGKSSLLYLLGLLDKPSIGEVFVNGAATSTLRERQLASIRLSTIGFIFQFHFLLPEFSALENVMIPMQRHGELSKTKICERGETLLSLFGLSDHSSKRPKQLSGGQSQRVAIARALANNPRIILADEPTGNLDSESSATVRGILRRLATEEGKAVIVVTHDSRFRDVADRQIVIVDGTIQPDGH